MADREWHLEWSSEMREETDGAVAISSVAAGVSSDDASDVSRFIPCLSCHREYVLFAHELNR
jgi:hypothetical protein